MDENLSKILFVDDDELVSEFAIMTMETQGFEVRYCESGEKALEEIQLYTPQMILLDMLMPGMDGIETFSALRQVPQVNNIPVVFLTGKAGEQDQRLYAELGALGVIAKPFDPAGLCSELNAMWEKGRGQ